MLPTLVFLILREQSRALMFEKPNIFPQHLNKLLYSSRPCFT